MHFNPISHTANLQQTPLKAARQKYGKMSHFIAIFLNSSTAHASKCVKFNKSAAEDFDNILFKDMYNICK